MYKVRNWSAYNTSLKKKGDVFFYFDKALLKNNWYFSSKRKPGGVVKYGDAVIEMMLAVRFIYRLPLRQTEGFVKSIIEGIGAKVDVPDYTTVCRRMSKLSDRVKLFKQINDSEALHVLIDSSGVSIYTATPNHVSKYRKDRISKNGKSWKKIHVLFDLKTAQAITQNVTGVHVQDQQAVPSLIEKCPYKIETLRADKAYDKRNCFRLLYAHGIKPIIPTIKTANIQKAGTACRPYEEAIRPRDDVITYIKNFGSYEEGLKAWYKESDYHQRSRIEVFFSRYKRTFGYWIASQKSQNRSVEIATKLGILNKAQQLETAKYERIEI